MKSSLSGKQQPAKSQQKQKQQQSNGGGKGKPQLKKWSKTFAGPKKTVDGRDYVWCKEHRREGDDGFDGLYMPIDQHPDHATWKANKDEWRAKMKDRRAKREKDSGSGGGGGKSSSGGNSATRTLQLNQSMKKVLMTKHGLSGNEVKELMEAQEN